VVKRRVAFETNFARVEFVGSAMLVVELEESPRCASISRFAPAATTAQQQTKMVKTFISRELARVTQQSPARPCAVTDCSNWRIFVTRKHLEATITPSGHAAPAHYYISMVCWKTLNASIDKTCVP